MRTNTYRESTSALALIGLALLATPAVAQSASEGAAVSSEIVVTAQRRQERAVDVPISVTALGGDTLQTANVQQLVDISKVTPSLRFDNAGAFWQPTIRGIGTAVTTSGGGGNVGIYIDGFYSPNPLATNMQLVNVQSIQVLKGPQGTLFGRNTTGGAILIQSNDPSTDTGGQVKLSYGRYNELKGQGYLTYGISDRVAMDFEGMYSRGDGWQRNVATNARLGGYKNWSARIGLKAELSDATSILIRYQHVDIDDPSPILTSSYRDAQVGSGAPASALPGQFTFDKNKVATGSDPEFFRSQSNTLQATVKADMGFADLTSYSQYRKEKVDSSIELDYSGVDIFQLGLPNDNETWSQELLLTSKPGGKLQWTVGAFYFSNRDTYIVFADNFPAIGVNNKRSRFGGSSTTTRSLAAFADATYEVTPKLFLTAGLRYAHDKIDDAYYDQVPVVGGPATPIYVRDVNPAAVDRVDKGRVTPRVVVRYKPTDESSIYASFTKGYKAALLDVGGNVASCGPGTTCSVRPETINAYEVGFKYDDRKLSFETSAFYYDYKDLQVSLFITGTAKIVNAATSEIYGLDGQVRYDFDDHFQVNAGAAWVHARYKEFVGAPIYARCTFGAACGIATFIIDSSQTLRNVTMQRTPEFTGNVGARYKTEVGGGELSLSGNLFYSSKFFFGPSGVQFPQKGYEVLSLRAQWTDPSDKFTLAVWGDNVTNSRYLTQVQYNNPGIGANWSKPVTFGGEIGVKF